MWWVLSYKILCIFFMDKEHYNVFDGFILGPGDSVPIRITINYLDYTRIISMKSSHNPLWNEVKSPKLCQQFLVSVFFSLVPFLVYFTRLIGNKIFISNWNLVVFIFDTKFPVENDKLITNRSKNTLCAYISTDIIVKLRSFEFKFLNKTKSGKRIKCLKFRPNELKSKNKNNPEKNKQTNDGRKTIEKYDLSNNFRMLVAVQDTFKIQMIIIVRISNERKQWAQTT